MNWSSHLQNSKQKLQRPGCENFLNYNFWFDHHISKIEEKKLLGPGCEKLLKYYSWFDHHIFKSQNKIASARVVKNCGPKCIEKTTPYIYSILKITINFLLNHLWWWIYVRFENCEIAIHSQSVFHSPALLQRCASIGKSAKSGTLSYLLEDL